MKTKSIILFALILIIFNSCEKERKPTVYNIDQELKDWMFFDTSTWWLYENIKTGELDSQYVTKSNIYYIESENIKGEPYYKHQGATISTNTNISYLLTPFYCLKENNSINEGGYTYIFFKPLNKPLTVGERRSSCSSLGYTEMTAIDNNFTLDNVYYNTKITVFDNKDCTEGNDSVEYQIFKGVGIINKKNITKNQEWKLIKYHIKLNKN